MSIYLDAVRFVAALTVFFSHLSGKRFTGGLFWQLGPYGDEAVDVFFVLSGFVIAFVADRSESNTATYAVARLARIYSVALPALVTTFILDAIGRSIRPDLYSAAWGYVTSGQIQQFFSSVFFVNRLWWNDIKQGSDVSYWSLNYEVWYYVIFAAAFYSRGWWKIFSTIAAVCIVGPNILALFPLWLLGVACYRVCKLNTFTSKLGAILCLGPLLIWAGYEIWAWHYYPRGDQAVPGAWFHRPQILQDYLVAALFGIHLVGFHAISKRFTLLFSRVGPAIRWFAGATFTIYLFHVPVAQFLTTIIPWPPSSWVTRVIIFVGTLAIMLLIAEVTERRKEPWRNFFAAILIRRPRVVQGA